MSKTLLTDPETVTGARHLIETADPPAVSSSRYTWYCIGRTLNIELRRLEREHKELLEEVVELRAALRSGNGNAPADAEGTASAPSRFGQCPETRKRQYESEAAAKQAMASMGQKMRTYRCPFCHKVHLTKETYRR